jgi:methyl-accepting chemotaxis protein
VIFPRQGTGLATSEKVSPDQLGRFDQSFFVHMTWSFLVFLLFIAGAELGIRYAILQWQFYSEGDEPARVAADQLAADITNVMLNSGGPIASRTLYPILERNFERGGLHIAIEPSDVTVTSIEDAFGWTPKGIPADWPDGDHHESSVDIRAEEFCLQCHRAASVGDVLGTVTVRQYVDEGVAVWWEEVRLTILVNIVKIVVHTVGLFFLLRVLLEPLLALRGAVASLAKGAAGLNIRAEVRSRDEFGSLAHDLNTFLDRVNHILHDFGRVLARNAAIGQRLATVTGRSRDQVDVLERAIKSLLSSANDSASPEDRARRLESALPRLHDEIHEFRHIVSGMEFLEENLNEVSASGEQLYERLVRREDDSA